MTKKLISLLFICALGLGFSTSVNAMPSVEEALKNLKSLREKACRKGNIFSATFSIRSFEGRLCEYASVALVAEKLCQSTQGYKESQCHKNALKVVGNATPADKAKAEEVLAK